MNVLFIGDSHLLINKFTLATQFLSWLNKFIEEHRPDLVVNLGDALDTHAIIRSEILNELMSHIYHVIDLGIPYVYVAGNHDYSSPKDSKYHALLPFKDRIDKLHVVDSPQNLFGMTFVPYMVKAIDFPKDTLPICVAHQTFLGADYGPVNALEGVDAETIAADIIISGHIHKKHNLGKVVYVGSPYSQDGSDVDQVKGLSLFDTDTYKFTFFPSPFSSWRSIKFEFSAKNTGDELHSYLEQSLKGSQDHWLIEISGPKAEVVGYIDSARYLKLIKGVSIRLKTVFTDKEKRKISIKATSMDQVISDFVYKVYSGSLDKEKILEKATAILEDVKLKLT